MLGDQERSDTLAMFAVAFSANNPLLSQQQNQGERKYNKKWKIFLKRWQT